MRKFFLIILITSIFQYCAEYKAIEFVALQANFSPSQYFVQEGDTLRFLQSSNLGADTYQWDFGDQTGTSTERNPQYIYSNRGSYTVSLTTYKKDNEFSAQSDTNIVVLPVTDSDVGFVKQLGNIGVDEQAFTFTRVSDGWVIAARENSSTLYLVKINNSFAPVWEKRVSNITNSELTPTDVFVTADDKYIVVGYYKSGVSDNDSFIIQFDSFLEEEWRQIQNTSRDEVFKRILFVGTNYLVAGNRTTDGQTSVSLELYSTSGTQEGEGSFADFSLNDIKQTKDGGFIMAGLNKNGFGSLVKFNSSLSTEWQWTATSTENLGQVNATVQLEDGNYACVGEAKTVTGENLGSKHAFAALIDDAGNLEWQRTLSFYDETFYDLQAIGTELIAIGTHFNPLSKDDAFLAKFQLSDGALVNKAKLIGQKNSNRIFALQGTDMGELVLLGSSTEDGSIVNDIYLLELTTSDF